MKSLLFAALLFFSAIANAQSDSKVHFGNEYKGKSALYMPKDIISDEHGGTILIEEMTRLIGSPKGFVVTFFDGKLNFVTDFEYEVSKTEYLGAFVNHDSLFIMTVHNDKEMNEYSVDVHSTPLGVVRFRKHSIISMDEDFFKNPHIPALASSWEGDWPASVAFSPNKQFLAVCFDLKNSKMDMQKVVVFDSHFNQVYEQVLKHPVKDRNFTRLDIKMTNDGSVYYLGSYRKARDKTGQSILFSLARLSSDGQKQVQLRGGNEFNVTSLGLALNEHRLSCVGFYSKRANRYEGLTRFDLDIKDLTIENKFFLPFSEQFLQDKFGKKKPKKVTDLIFKGIHLFENGDIVFNGQEFELYVDYEEHKSYRLYGDIVTCRISGEGKLLWARNINKPLANDPRLGSSYITLMDDEKEYIMLYSKFKRTKVSDYGRLVLKPGKDLVLLTVNYSGNMDYELLVPNKETSYFFHLSRARYTGGRTMTFFAARIGSRQLMRISL